MTPRYRAWIKTEKRMIETDDILGIDYENKEIVTQQIYFKNGLPDDRDIYFYDFDEIVLMQSTGLKDKNGKEIFDGDVVKCNGLLGTIESFKAMWICSFVKYNNYQKVGFFAREIEVVGNIYENPDLLEDKE